MGLAGGLSGAASGAGLGTALLPGVGTAIGAIGGGLLGLFGGGDNPAPTSPVTPEMIAAANGQVGATQQQQAAFLQALQAQGGLQNQSNIYNQLGGIVDGTGPNPAMAALHQATSQNVANQAALMAGARGASTNAGLIARQAAQQGGAIQQQAVGQGATLQAQQALGALGQQGNIAGQQVGNQLTVQQQVAQNALGNQSTLLGLNSQFNAPLAQGQQAYDQKLVGGLLNGGAVAAAGLAGGKPKVNPNDPSVSGLAPGQAGPSAAYMAEGGMIEADGKENTFDFEHIEKFLHGGKVDGKASVKGDSVKNDKVHALLSPGEVVIPRSVMQSADPAGESAKFVQAIMARKHR